MVINIDWLSHVAHVVAPSVTLIGHNGGNIHLTQLFTKGLHSSTWHAVFHHINVLIYRTLCNCGAFKCRERARDTLTGSTVASGTGFVVYRFSTLVEFRSEEHTSELQSRPRRVCRLLL